MGRPIQLPHLLTRERAGMAAGQAVRKEGKSQTEQRGDLCAQTRVKSLRKRRARRNEAHNSSETGDRTSEIQESALTGSGNKGVTVNSLYVLLSS